MLKITTILESFFFLKENMKLFFSFLVRLGIKLRASHLQSRHYTA
jgi:hypothetical protein